MEKIIKKIVIVCSVCLIAFSSIGQLPLLPGDMVVTYKYGLYSNSYSNNVVSVIKTRNTSSATAGQVWLNPGIYSNPNWTRANLGDVFGITIDNNGNIYLSSTSIYGGGTTPSKIFTINGSSELITTIADNTTNAAFVGPYGNLKFISVGGNDYIYVSDWGNGYIHRLRRISGVWQYQNSFNPEFGRISSTPLQNNNYSKGQIAYGLAIRQLPNDYRLYYSRIGNSYSRNGNTGMSNGYSNEIWYVKLDNTGNFITTGPVPPNGEYQQTIPYDPGSTTSVGSNTGNGVLGFRFNNPIADIAFTSDGQKMLLGQQPLVTLSQLGSHSSEVREFVESPIDSWINSGNLFPTGQEFNGGGAIPVHQTNAIGGVSYSNNILYKDSTFTGCDSTIWAVSDLLAYPVSNTKIPILPATCYFTYGLQGFTSQGIQPYSLSNTSYQNSLLIDEDGDYGSQDKYHLGDVEVYKTPLECLKCSCGKFSNPVLNDQLIPVGGMVNNAGTVPTGYKLSFVQGNITGVFHITYQCNGTCDAKTEWSISKSGIATEPRTKTDDGDIIIDFGNDFKNLECGTYNLVIVPTCGDKKCDPFIMQIDIVCEPPSCCVAKIEIEEPEITIAPVTIPNGRSVLTGNIKFNSDQLMSEVRVSVDEFRLSANSENCLLCKNKPYTWGNIISASLNGIPGKLYDGSLLSGSHRQVDNRESIFSNGQPLNLSPGYLSFNLGLPAITDLECCEVTVYLCIKITFKDVNCRECVRMICDKYTLKKNSKTNDGKPREKRSPVIFTPIY